MFKKSCGPVFVILTSSILFLPSSLAQILSSIDFKFREEQVQGSYVGNVAVSSRLATTLSENEFSRLKFNLPDSKYFRIDEKSGSLISAVRIDREDVCQGQDACKLTNEIIVYTRIGAGNYDILKVITMNVEIVDINDNSPEFPSRVVGLKIPESNDLNHALRTRSAVDKDTGENSVKEYRFQDLTNTFRLSVHKNPDGSSYLGIVVKEKLDREVRDFYQVTIVATDGGFPQRSGSVVINITVEDVNDNSPEFSQSSYNETMQENMALRVPIMKVRAIDADTGGNSEISYQFSSRVSNKFRQKFYIDGYTGEIFAQNNIDFEEDKLFQFIVEAVDHGTPQMTSRTNVNLHVVDMNDNSPQILINLPPTGTEVAENEPVGKFIAHLTIIDLDSGNNGVVVCTMDDENFALEKFIDHSSNRYKVVLAKALDYEQSEYHRVSIACSDGGVPQLSNSTTFIVSVLDVNDNRPVFTESTYTKAVLENQEGDEEILVVTALDSDKGDFGRVSYIIEDKFADVFSIHQATGEIRVLRMLDREDVARYEFYVIAQDNGPERLSSSALVVIIVDDENDEPPRFVNTVYFGEVLENQPVGTSVGVAIAVDNDSPANAQMAYSILDLGEDFIHFSIDPATGIIKSESTFDREKKEYYHLMIRVVDPTKLSFFSVCNFTIRVLDENDHAPVIRVSSEDNSTLFISYSAPIGSVITNVFAYDGDETSSIHSKLRFLIDKGDPEQLFELNSYTGSLTLAREITARDFKTYNLVIVVDDGGTPPRFDTKHLSIKVNGTIPEYEEAGISENIIIAIIIVCVTVILAFVIVITILLIRKFDRQRRRNRANEKITEENMYQLNRQELFNDLGPARPEDFNLNKRSKKETKELNSSLPMLDTGPEGRRDLDQRDHLRSPPRDEECRLIEILQKNDGDAGSDSSEDTDPSDSGRGGSEDETSHRGCGVDHEHPGNKLHHSNYHRGPPPSSDNKNKPQPYHQQKLIPAKSTSKSSLYSSKPHLQPGPSKRSSYTSDVDSEVSGIRGSQNRLDNERAVTAGNQSFPSGRNSENLGRSTNQTLPFQREKPSSQKLTKDSNSRLGTSSDAINSSNQTFHGPSGARLQTAPTMVNPSKGRPSYHGPFKSYGPPSRQYKYTDRAYPVSGRLSSPTSLPEDDDRTTTSGSYTVNPEELRDDLHSLVLHDTVV